MFVEGGLKKGTLNLGFYCFHLPTSSHTLGLTSKSPSQSIDFGELILTYIGLVLFIICLMSVTSYPWIHLDNFVFLKEICPKSGCKYMVTLL